MKVGGNPGNDNKADPKSWEKIPAVREPEALLGSGAERRKVADNNQTGFSMRLRHLLFSRFPFHTRQTSTPARRRFEPLLFLGKLNFKISILTPCPLSSPQTKFA